jgi:DNA-binding CsgD family transcriptional regulator
VETVSPILVDKQAATATAAPAIFIVDHRGDLQSHAEGAVTWELVAPFVRAVLEHDGNGKSFHEELLGERLSVRVAPLDSGQFVVIAEPIRSRDPLRGMIQRHCLTKRESEVIGCLIEGASTSEIAARLGISPATVILHVKRILAKTGTRTRVDLVALAAGLRSE